MEPRNFSGESQTHNDAIMDEESHTINMRLILPWKIGKQTK